MKIKKVKLENFKKFKAQIFDFNDDINIIAGDNECGKSSLIEAIEICLNFRYRGKSLNSELTTELFNNDCVETYLKGDLSQQTLPEILIETYLEGDPNLKGDKNSEGGDSEGIFIKICFDPELVDPYANFIKEPEKVLTLPVEFYKIDWYSFAWNRMTYHNKGINCLFVDPSRLHPTFGRAKYINGIINAALDKKSRSTLNLNYRQLKARFDEEKDVVAINEKLDAKNDITNKTLKITADIASNTSWESNLQLAVDDVTFNQIGKGEQNQIQIKLVLQNSAEDVDVVMIEEPENHLSHINLVQLISYIENKNQGKQIFLTTHSSYVLNKLSIDKLCLLANGYKKFKDIDPSTVKTLKRLPGYDTLRVILAKKIILVEGPSDELLLKKIHINQYGVLPEEQGIDIIVVRGLGFKNYLNIAKPLSQPVRVVRDNDGNYEKNIIDWMKEYKDCDFLKCFSPKDNEQYSLEPAIIENNSGSIKALDRLAKIFLSKQTYKTYREEATIEDKKAFLKKWFWGKSSGGKKVDSAIRIFESGNEIIFPEYLLEAIHFDE